MTAQTMRNTTFVLNIEPWNEGPTFLPVLRTKRSEYPLRVRHPFELNRFRPEGESLKPVGFYIAYSYTLFRKNDGAHHPFYAFF